MACRIDLSREGGGGGGDGGEGSDFYLKYTCSEVGFFLGA